jgi:hypothetical protein
LGREAEAKTMEDANAEQWPSKRPPSHVTPDLFQHDVRYFVDMSVELTGFQHADLYGTGSAEEYLRTFVERAGRRHAHALYQRICGEDLAGLFGERVPVHDKEPLAHALAAAVTKMWYLGSWEALDDEDYALLAGACRRDQQKVKPKDRIALPANTSFVISPNAYLNGLVWKLTTGHPIGGKPTGFGTWAAPVKGGGR